MPEDVPKHREVFPPLSPSYRYFDDEARFADLTANSAAAMDLSLSTAETERVSRVQRAYVKENLHRIASVTGPAFHPAAGACKATHKHIFSLKSAITGILTLCDADCSGLEDASCVNG